MDYRKFFLRLVTGPGGQKDGLMIAMTDTEGPGKGQHTSPPAWTPATRRVDVLPPDVLKDNQDDLSPWAMIALQRSLLAAGMPPGQVPYFVDLLWRCGIDLQFAPTLDDLATDCGIKRQTLSAKVKTWEAAGLIIRTRTNYGGRSRFLFPTHDALINRLRLSLIHI